MSAIRAERDYVIHEDFMKVKCFHLVTLSRSFMLYSCDSKAWSCLAVMFVSASVVK